MPQSESTWRAYLTPLNILLLLVPVAAVVHFGGFAPVWVFVSAGVAIIPLAGYMGKATEALADKLGPAAGGLLNASFGNAAELIIALMILAKGPDYYPIVKATITGSIIGNLLLILGLSIFLGGLGRQKQSFNPKGAGVGATLLAIAAAGLILPTLFFYLPHGDSGSDFTRKLNYLSEEIAVVLIVVYGLSLLFSLRTHKQLFMGDEPAEGHDKGGWSVGMALGVLVAATVGVAFMSEWLVGTVEPAAESLGMNNIFIGVIVVAIIGNAAEHSTAVLAAWRNRMDLAVQIAVGSSTQIALFVAPVLVFASILMGNAAILDLHFTLLEMVAVILSVAVTTLVCHDGESNWLEGAMLLALYIILGLAFFNLPGE